MLKEGRNPAGEFRIPAGCAVSSVFSRSGRRLDGSDIIRSIAIMHDRSNGLGGGFAGYGIYPEYAEQYAFHVSTTMSARRRSARNSSTRISTSSTFQRSRPARSRRSPTSR